MTDIYDIIRGGVPLGRFPLGLLCDHVHFCLVSEDVFCGARCQKMAPRASSTVSKTKEIFRICYEKLEKKPNLGLWHHFDATVTPLCQSLVLWYNLMYLGSKDAGFRFVEVTPLLKKLLTTFWNLVFWLWSQSRASGNRPDGTSLLGTGNMAH